MAEVFGIVSAGVGIMAFIGQVSATLEKVNDAHQFVKGKAAEEIASLQTQLHLLQIMLQTLQPGDDNDMDVLLTGYHWHQFNTIQTSLSKLSTKLHERLESSSSLRRPSWRLVSNKADRQLREEITSASLKIQALIQVILLHAVVRPRQLPPKPGIEVHELPPVKVPIEDLCITDTIADNMLLVQSSIEQARSETVIMNKTVEKVETTCEPNTFTSRTTSFIGQPRRNDVYTCSNPGCCCKCHITAKIQRRFWAFEYTPLSIYLSDCDDNLCNSRRVRLGFRVAFSQYGIPFAVSIGFEAISEAGMRTLQPTLRTQQIVKYTSPGFQILWLAIQNFVTVDQAKEQLSDFFQREPTARNHVDPSGKGYLEVQVSHQLWYSAHIIDFGTGHALVVNTMQIQKTTVWIHRTPCLEACATPLGQTPLHLAVVDDQILDLILNSGHNVDVMDSFGDTPLAYAIRLGRWYPISRLLTYGASLPMGSLGSSFSELMSSYGDIDIVSSALALIQKLRGADVAQSVIGGLVHAGFIVNESRRSKNYQEIYDMLMGRWTSSSIIKYEVRGRSIMHVVSTVQEARNLVQRGFNRFDLASSYGHLAIHEHAYQDRDSLVEFCIEHGSNLEHKDKYGLNAFSSAFSRLRFSWKGHKASCMLSSRRILRAGTNVRKGGRCKCVCTSADIGCSSAEKRIHADIVGPRDYHCPSWITTLQYQSLLGDFQGVQSSRTALLGVIRRLEFDALRMTHACRCCRNGSYQVLKDTHIDETPVEQSHLLHRLDSSMMNLRARPLSTLQREFLLRFKQSPAARLHKSSRRLRPANWQVSKQSLINVLTFATKTVSLAVIGL
ncbi:predicted protein [Verticillium alfalfae VaMs.102]|uniref:Predicted protein n=1 Tax=Verticillium alfalfae (strain VaMs.102 / ATCC MYA-4576 / FGSC 10136) TaxID=526221 RepID=C9SSL2_VERA1|nr:predicted protein [Verticillium alfalfae VaMs.102]EEY21777.1 predicted protein [Verticillium alfalfae VaMs.102]